MNSLISGQRLQRTRAIHEDYNRKFHAQLHIPKYFSLEQNSIMLYCMCLLVWSAYLPSLPIWHSVALTLHSPSLLGSTAAACTPTPSCSQTTSAAMDQTGARCLQCMLSRMALTGAPGLLYMETWGFWMASLCHSWPRKQAAGTGMLCCILVSTCT